MSAQPARRVPAGPLRGTLLLVCFGVVVVAVTGLAADSLYAWRADAGARDPSLVKLSVRVLEVVALLATVPLLLALGRGGREAWGLRWRPRPWRRFASGFALGLASLGLVCAVIYALEVRVLRPDLPVALGHWALVVAKAVAAALVIAFTEELWFRGGLHGALQGLGGAPVAVALTAAVYSGAHFLASDPGGIAADASAFAALAHAFTSIWRLEHLDSAAALLIAGLLLAMLRIRHGDVAGCIGLHAGWVTAIKVFKKATHIEPHARWRSLVGQYDDVIGWAACVVLALLTATLWWRGRRT